MLCSALISIFAYAEGGTQLGSTRLIYPQGNSEVSISLANTSKNARYLIQSWVSDENGKANSEFIITPPLFVSKPDSENSLRIMNINRGENLPNDKESIFYLHSKSIPSLNPSEVQGKNVLQIAFESVIKIFVRPKNLPITTMEAYKQISCSLNDSKLVINNPSPYYITLVNIYVGNRKQSNMMVPPKNNSSMNVNSKGDITYQIVNDYGGIEAKKNCVLKYKTK